MKIDGVEILPCPFCGCEAQERANGSPFRIGCDSRIGGEDCPGNSRWSTIEAWNTRAKGREELAFDQYQQSLAALMAENEALKEKANHTEGIVNLACEVMGTNMGQWSAAHISSRQAEILNRLTISARKYILGQNG